MSPGDRCHSLSEAAKPALAKALIHFHWFGLDRAQFADVIPNSGAKTQDVCS